MWSSLNSIKSQIHVIRYLIVLRINSTLVHLPGCPSVELSRVLGAIIAERLPTKEGRSWQKALEAWKEYPLETSVRPQKNRRRRGIPRLIPEVSWPIESVLFVYPGKRTYGQGELILWELKLLGESADHGLFLEVLLPAIEEAGYTSNSRWRRPNKLWGRFDIHAVYVARGSRWEPLVSEGKLDLRYRATPLQWVEGVACDVTSVQRLGESPHLRWLTPFDFDTAMAGNSPPKRPNKTPSSDEIPTLRDILEALLSRLSSLMKVPDDLWSRLDPEEQSALRKILERSNLGLHNLKPAPKHWPGRWIGTQVFSSISSPILPYLELASIVHIGKQTHFGCGTFVLTPKAGRSTEVG